MVCLKYAVLILVVQMTKKIEILIQKDENHILT